MSIFSKPYPKDAGVKKKIITGVVFGLFIFLFLLFFQPFGINEWHVAYKTWRMFGYGVITMGIVLFNSMVIENIFKAWFREKDWKVGKEIVWVTWNMMLIGIANLLYTHYQIGFPLTWLNFINYQWITLSIGIFPVTIATLINYTRLNRQNLYQARQINQVIEADTVQPAVAETVTLVTLLAENNKDELRIPLEDLLYLESADNYVHVVWMEKGGLKKVLLRNTLKNLEEKLKAHPFLFRCHRSYMANLQKVVKVSGNSQGYKLHFAEADEMVPVSRSLNEVIRKKISDIHTRV